MRCPLLVLIMVLSNLAAAQIAEVVVGFDGHLVPDRHNPVQVLLVNPDPVTWQGLLEARLDFHFGAGEKQRLAVALAPGGSRWVELPCWCGPQAPTRLYLACRDSDGALRAEHEVEDLLLGDPCRLALRGPVPLRGLRRAQLPVEHFPSTVGLCDGLRGLAMDHLPHWNPAQRRAFCDWLHAGGELDLLPDAAGRPLAFAAPWPAELQAAIPSGRFGTGVIRVHEAVADLDVEPAAADPGSADYYWENAGAMAFPLFRRLSRPDLSWPAIALVLVCYVLAIFPGAWLLGRRLDYRLALGGLLGLAVLATLVVGAIGRRGYGEVEQLHAISLARQLPDARWDVSQWGGLFVTDGGWYHLDWEGEGLLVCGGDPDQRSPMRRSDRGVRLPVPLLSTETWYARWVAPGPAVQARLTQAERDADGRIIAGTISVAGLDAVTDDAALVYDGGRSTHAQIEDGRLRFAHGWLDHDGNHFETPNRYDGYGVEPELRSSHALGIVATWSGLGATGRHMPAPRVAPGRLRLLLVTRDERFRPLDLSGGQRRVVYDLVVEEATQP